jgi:hypothetical protein
MVPRKRQALGAQEAELVPVASLEDDLSVDDVEEPAATQAEGVAPFENGPLAVLEQVFHHADHLGLLEAGREHPAKGLAALHGLFGDLMVDGVFAVHRDQGIDVGPIERVDPGSNHFGRLHRHSSLRVSRGRRFDGGAAAARRPPSAVEARVVLCASDLDRVGGRPRQPVRRKARKLFEPAVDHRRSREFGW